MAASPSAACSGWSVLRIRVCEKQGAKGWELGLLLSVGSPPLPWENPTGGGATVLGPLCGLEGPECVCGKMDAFITM